MGIYAPLGGEGFELCLPVRQEDFERLNMEINGRPRSEQWTPVDVGLVRHDQGRELAASDSPWLGSHALIFKRTAVEAMGPLLRDNGELLPLASAAGELWVYNPQLCDALDEAASSVQRLTAGRIWMIDQHIFRPDRVHGVDAFKIPNLRVSPTFVSKAFVDRWNSEGLNGLEFTQVWTPSN